MEQIELAVEQSQMRVFSVVETGEGKQVADIQGLSDEAKASMAVFLSWFAKD